MKRNGHAKLIGCSAQMANLQLEIERVAQSDAKVLITGESGVGKELVAKAVHAGSRRADRPFMPVNCAGVPETLLESELFGHVRGSFTGAYRDKAGKLEVADTGTVLLDEIGEMSLRMQGMLLRFLETGELQKVGTDRITRTVDIRVIAATNRDLRDLITQGQFRDDLYYRLNVVNLVVPPLRERREDIPLLVQHFLDTHVRGMPSGGVRRISPEALEILRQYGWPGNVRELQNVIERLVVTCRSEVVAVEDLPNEIRTPAGVALRPMHERRRTPADELYKRLVESRESFWAVVYPLYMQREITRTHLRDLVRKGLSEAKGNYRIVTRLFNIENRDYKKFLNFLRKQDCQLPFKEYRQ
jgi:transcriptional regulator with PAS, ATPase and Fis domain